MCIKNKKDPSIILIGDILYYPEDKVNLLKEEITRLKAEIKQKDELMQTKVDYYENKLESMQRTLDNWYTELERERELRKELVGYVVAYHGLSSLTSEEDIYIRSLIKKAKN